MKRVAVFLGLWIAIAAAVAVPGQVQRRPIYPAQNATNVGDYRWSARTITGKKDGDNLNNYSWAASNGATLSFSSSGCTYRLGSVAGGGAEPMIEFGSGCFATVTAPSTAFEINIVARRSTTTGNATLAEVYDNVSLSSGVGYSTSSLNAYGPNGSNTGGTTSTTWHCIYFGCSSGNIDSTGYVDGAGNALGNGTTGTPATLYIGQDHFGGNQFTGQIMEITVVSAFQWNVPSTDSTNLRRKYYLAQ